MTSTNDFIEYAFLPTESGIILIELNTELSSFRKIISTNDIMEAETRPNYHKFLKEWSSKNKITSFFGSDKPDFLQAWNNVKNGGEEKVEPVVAISTIDDDDDDELDDEYDEQDREEFGGVDIKVLEKQLKQYYEPGIKNVNTFIDMIKKNGNKNPYYEKYPRDGEPYFDIDAHKNDPISNGNITFVLNQKKYYLGVIRDIKKRISFLKKKNNI